MQPGAGAHARFVLGPVCQGGSRTLAVPASFGTACLQPSLALCPPWPAVARSPSPGALLAPVPCSICANSLERSLGSWCRGTPWGTLPWRSWVIAPKSGLLGWGTGQSRSDSFCSALTRSLQAQQLAVGKLRHGTVRCSGCCPRGTPGPCPSLQVLCHPLSHSCP